MPAKKPVLTVCVITYNHARYIREALDSILAQKTNFEWQVVVADDRSTDGTRDILLEYEKKFPKRVHLILQKHNVGAEENWLDLIAYPKSKYLLYMEGDDYFVDNTKLQKQVDFLEAHPDFSLCFHPVRVVYEDGSKEDELFPTPEQRAHKKVLKLNDLLAYNFIQTDSVMYRWRFAAEDVKEAFPRNIIPGDWMLHLMHAESGKIGFIDAVMAVYRRHPGSMWWQAEQNKQEFWKKYAAPHLRLYREMLKRYGDTKSSRIIIAKKISELFGIFADIDMQQGSHLVRAAITDDTQTAELFMISMHEALQYSEHELHDLQRVDEYRRWALEEKDKQISQEAKQSNEQIAALRNSKSFRVGYNLLHPQGIPRRVAHRLKKTGDK
ncbi:MAG TPA: glycosyltransferase [Candidatus Saccharimonadales bacterium]|nr:glycosyltransferase [Candidatus Saccharimonadales bacterium]